MTTPIDGREMLRMADTEAKEQIIRCDDILEIDKNAQPRLQDIDNDKVRGIAADILFRHTQDGIPQVDCLDVIPYVQVVPRPGSVQFTRIAGNHRINSYQLNNWEKIKVKVLPSDFFARTGIPRGLFQLASSPKPLQDGHDLREIEAQLMQYWDVSPINGDKDNALVWLRSISQYYSDDEYRKMVNRIHTERNKVSAEDREASTLIRTYESGKVNDKSSHSAKMRNQNFWFEHCRASLPTGGNWVRFNASTRNLWHQTIGSMLTALSDAGVFRDEDGKYPEDREDNNILFSVKPDKPAKYTEENMKNLINKNLKKMIDVIESQDLPFDAIYRYPQFMGEGKDDPEKAILLWTKAGGRVKQ